MRQKGPLEMQRAAILKAKRWEIRMRHSLAADDEINEVLPALEDEIEKAIAAGKPLELEGGR